MSLLRAQASRLHDSESLELVLGAQVSRLHDSESLELVLGAQAPRLHEDRSCSSWCWERRRLACMGRVKRLFPVIRRSSGQGVKQEMTSQRKMICPDCGVEMNHHADKIDYDAALRNPESADPDLGGVVQETHTCPGCGTSKTRRAE